MAGDLRAAWLPAILVVLLASCTAPMPAPRNAASVARVTQAGPGACHYRLEANADLPDPACTPGDADPRVTQANIHDTICVSGYTSTVRPPVSVTEPIKRERMHSYGLDGQSASSVELDHLVPLEVGGSSDVKNLWPEPYAGSRGARTKDRLENRLHSLICSGQLALPDAQAAVAGDWIAAYEKYVTS